METLRTSQAFRKEFIPQFSRVDNANALATPKKLHLSWQTVYDGVDSLAIILSNYGITRIVGIARGGLIPATLLSHKLGIPLSVISASAYEGTRRTLEKPIILEGWKPEYNVSSVVVIDDILDSGNTYERIVSACHRDNQASAFKYASLVSKNPLYDSRHEYFIRVPKDVWVVFPWEQNES